MSAFGLDPGLASLGCPLFSAPSGRGLRVNEARKNGCELPGEYYQVQKAKGDDIFVILKAFGMELKPQLYTRGEIREMKATASPF